MFDRSPSRELFNCHRYEDFLNEGTDGAITEEQLERAETRVQPADVLNMQFTSGEIIPYTQLGLRLTVWSLTYSKVLLAFRKSPCSHTSKNLVPVKPLSIL